MTKKKEEAVEPQEVQEEAQAEREFESEREVTLSDGTIVRCVSVSPLLIQEVTMQSPTPDAPVKTVKTAPGLEETYVDTEDKGWLRRVAKAEEQQRHSSTNAMLLMGLPDVDCPEDDRWAEEMGALGIDIPPEGPLRRLAFIKFKLLRRSTDLMLVVETLTQISGATEGMIAEAERDFE